MSEQTYTIELTRDELQVMGLVLALWSNENFGDDSPLLIKLALASALMMWHPEVFRLHLETIIVKGAVLEDEAIPGDEVMPGIRIAEGDRKDAQSRMRARLDQRRAELREAGLL